MHAAYLAGASFNLSLGGKNEIVFFAGSAIFIAGIIWSQQTSSNNSKRAGRLKFATVKTD